MFLFGTVNFFALRAWNDMKSVIGKRIILSLKTTLDFCSAPSLSWGNFDVCLLAADTLIRKRPEEQILLLGADIDDIIIEIGCKKDEPVSSICIKMKEVLLSNKCYHTKVRRFFSIFEQLGKLTKIWTTLKALMRISQYVTKVTGCTKEAIKEEQKHQRTLAEIQFLIGKSAFTDLYVYTLFLIKKQQSQGNNYNNIFR